MIMTMMIMMAIAVDVVIILIIITGKQDMDVMLSDKKNMIIKNKQL